MIESKTKLPDVLEVKLKYSNLTPNLNYTLERELKEKYINRLRKDIIIKDFELSNTISPLYCLTGTIKVGVNVTKFLKYEEGDILEGYIDMSQNPPLFRTEHGKFLINNIMRQFNILVTSKGTKLNNNDKVNATITKLHTIEGSYFFSGFVDIE